MMDKIIAEDIQRTKDNLKEFNEKVSEKTFLVTGGAGFIGSWFCDVLVELGAYVTCVDNLSTGSNDNINHLLNNGRFNFINGDVLNFSTTESFDYMIHMASIASPLSFTKLAIETLDANTFGTRRMLELAVKNEVKGFLFTSTSEVYGNPPDENIPTPETYYGYVNSYGPRATYDEGKRCAEAYCLAFRDKFTVPTRIARIFNTYGPRLDVKQTSQYGRVMAKFIHQALTGVPLTVYGDGTQTRSFCYITDQVTGLMKLLLLSNLDGEVINIGNDHEITILELADRTIKLANSKSKKEFLPLPEDDPRRRKPNISKAKKLLRFNPQVSLDEGLTRTIQWIKDNLRFDI